MRTDRSVWTKANGWSAAETLTDADWVLYFAAPEALDDELFAGLRKRYPSLDAAVVITGEAASNAQEGVGEGIAVLVSCIGRKLLMGQKTADEVEAVAEVLGAAFAMVGFYSYGEIAPGCSGFSDLHNQTMTVTTFGERRAA